MSYDARKSPRNNPIKLSSSSPSRIKSMFSSANIKDLTDEDIKPPIPFVKKRDDSSTEIIKPVLSRSRKVKTNIVTHIKETPKELDLLLTKMGMMVLYSFVDDNPEIIMTMTPIGTIVGIKLDTDKNITISEEKRINMTSSSGISNINGSYLTSLSKNTDVRSFVVCQNGLCVLNKDNMGKIEANNYNLTKSLSNSPSSYPLVLLGELIENYREDYISFLMDLREQSNKINMSKDVNSLTRNIEFLENLLTNLKNVQNKAKSFELANKEELSLYSDKAIELLRKDKKDQEILDKLYSLNCNISFLNDGINKFNSFRECLDSMEQETYSYYFALYGRIVKTIDTPSSIKIRQPSSWSLSSILPETESFVLKNGNNISSKELVKIIRSDMSKYNYKNNEEESNLLMKTLQTSFK